MNYRNFFQEVLKEDYSLQDIRDIRSFLTEKGTFHFSGFDNGLFPAAIAADAKNTGYKNVWVRDNIYVAYAHYVLGQPEVTAKNLWALMAYFKKFRFRFEAAVDTQRKPYSAMERPNIRFNGRELTELDEPWEHAQNDALGYFLWLFCKLHTEAKQGIEGRLQTEDWEMLALFPLYFQAIRYWDDEDSGHWEEEPKIEASSIGAVIAGLKALRVLLNESSQGIQYCQYKNEVVGIEFLDELIARGSSALDNILPWECVQRSKQRRYDGALLFLIYPLNVVNGDMAEQIISDVTNHLQGEVGIRRYLNDTFWCRDFQDLPRNIQTSKHTDRQKWFDQNNKKISLGEEAQWCIFDPILSSIYGYRFQTLKREDAIFIKQVKYLNRSLRQVTDRDFQVKTKLADGTAETIEIEVFKCPELYFIQKGHYIPNVSTPLLWTQANLLIALEMMEQSLRLI